MLHFLSLSDATDLCCIKQYTQQEVSLVNTVGLNLLINKAGVLTKGPLQGGRLENMQTKVHNNVEHQNKD